ncbi:MULTISPECIES: LytTR family DNA-binding domain-containing protein [Staphylococcus]|jgi:DNA-binding LytR/AlgR family response regulator|uniref:LytTr DNA-binding domain protein n=1 Tax=Staphylococcus lugdunensis TaxID=28035 RepID=A0ABD4EI78_STALU|nr:MULTISPECIES: LytTR family DNA-binding domain-containing protein [Staphylococcus]ADC86824.1 hypothetical protein SLGD_00676 [Staphylococcus lugdunensis HKU09-01]AMG63818.1 DNA-binding response regulator [Staphylococcus lugdunensis]ARB77112.1 DNA-binding response regulator [Staphylococcus lugdunensis]ARJ08560.1 LytTR family transcriptional regulator [Staphylococcus lugdunensis]ARJ13310.1 LytTR family transcriptional regulator [Staphylococcus lugdunensis]
MKLKLFISPKETEQYVAVHSPILDNDTQTVIDTVNQLSQPKYLTARHDEDIYRLAITDITTFRTQHKTVTAVKDHTTYVVKERLYQLENMLTSNFIRISKSEIVNIDKIIKLQLEPNGLIRMYLEGCDYTYSSRRYLKSIKERLSI